MRLLGSVQVAFASDSCPGAETVTTKLGFVKKVDIGLRLTGKDLPMIIERLVLIALVGEIMREYSRVCPFITAWVGRGDFDPKKVPDRATSAVITHACRTAGRLRAKVMRKMVIRPSV